MDIYDILYGCTLTALTAATVATIGLVGHLFYDILPAEKGTVLRKYNNRISPNVVVYEGWKKDSVQVPKEVFDTVKVGQYVEWKNVEHSHIRNYQSSDDDLWIMNPGNPASPVSPLNPANPASPLNPLNMPR